MTVRYALERKNRKPVDSSSPKTLTGSSFSPRPFSTEPSNPTPLFKAFPLSIQTKSSSQKVRDKEQPVSSELESKKLDSKIQSAKATGQALTPELQAKFGQAMGADFSGVRIHNDSRSNELNQSIQAKAFTTGQDVFFRQGAYAPQSRSGQTLIAHELTHVMQQSEGSIRRSPSGCAPSALACTGSSQLATIQRSEEATATFQGFGQDAHEAGGNFFEMIDDVNNAIKAVKEQGSSKTEKAIAGSKALGSAIATKVSLLKANKIEKMTSCMEAMSEGLKIFDATKEVWEAVSSLNFQDTAMETFTKVAVVVGKLGDLVAGAGKTANAFVEAMAWTTGVLSDFAKWAPLSELIAKCVGFLTAVKDWISTFHSYKKLKEVKATMANPDRNKQMGYIVDEQWSKLKNGIVPIFSAGAEFASQAAKYLPSPLCDNPATAAGLGSLSKALPLGHKASVPVYDYVRQGWRNMAKNYAPASAAKYLADTDKADLPAFRKGLVSFVMAERKGPHGLTILESLGLTETVQTMNKNEARKAIQGAVKDIK